MVIGFTPLARSDIEKRVRAAGKKWADKETSCSFLSDDSSRNVGERLSFLEGQYNEFARNYGT